MARFDLCGVKLESHVSNCFCVVSMAKNARAGHKNVRARLCDFSDIVDLDTTVYFDIDLQLTFPAGYDWLAPSVTFQTRGLPLDGAWHPPQ